MSDAHNSGVADVVLVVGTTRFPCHRKVLSAASPYFQAMFAGHMMESTASEVFLHGTEARAIEELIGHAYSEQLVVGRENVQELLACACMYQFDAVADACCSYLVQNLTVANCLSMWELGDTFNVSPLIRHAKRQALWRFREVVQLDDFLEMPEKLLSSLLAHPGLNVSGEIEVFDAIVAWSNHRPNRLSHLPQLLHCLRLTNSPAEFLKYIHARLSENGYDTVPLSGFCTRLDSSGKRVTPLVPVVVGHLQTFLAKEPELSGQEIKLRIYRDDSSYEELASLNVGKQRFCHLSGFVAGAVGKDVYIIGGEYGIGSGRWNMTVHRYDSFRDQWTEAAVLPSPRRHFLLVVVGTSLYLLGGFGRYRVVLNSVASFDTATGEWRERAPLPCPHFSALAASCRGDVYLFGARLYRYDPANDKWTAPSPDLTLAENRFVAAVSHLDRIYMIPSQTGMVKVFRPPSSLRDVTEIDVAVEHGCMVGDNVYCFDNQGTVVAFNVHDNTACRYADHEAFQGICSLALPYYENL